MLVIHFTRPFLATPIFNPDYACIHRLRRSSQVRPPSLKGLINYWCKIIYRPDVRRVAQSTVSNRRRDTIRDAATPWLLFFLMVCYSIRSSRLLDKSVSVWMKNTEPPCSRYKRRPHRMCRSTEELCLHFSNVVQADTGMARRYVTRIIPGTREEGHTSTLANYQKKKKKISHRHRSVAWELIPFLAL